MYVCMYVCMHVCVCVCVYIYIYSHEIWEPKPPGTLWATPSLLGDSFTFIYKYIHRVGINYRRISLRPVTRPDSVWFLPMGFRQGQCLRPTTSKDTTGIARAHQHRNRERHTRHAWESLAGMGVSSGHLPCHTWGAHPLHLRSLWNCRHSSFKW